MEEYEKLIDSFCQLQNMRKKEEIKNELQEILVLFHKLCCNKNSKDKMLLHSIMNKIEERNYSEEDFLNAVYAYIISIKESIGKYLS